MPPQEADFRRFHQPRVSSSWLSDRASAVEMPTIASPRPGETRARMLGVLEVRRRLDDRLGARRRIARLEDAGADEDAVGAELHAERRVGRRRDAARGEGHDRQLAVLGDPLDELVRGAAAPSPRRRAPPRAASRAGGCRRRPRACGVTALTMSPVPASPFVRIIAAPSAIRRSASPRLRAAADERHGELPLVDVMLHVGRRQHLGLVDVVDLERLRGSAPRRSDRCGTSP